MVRGDGLEEPGPEDQSRLVQRIRVGGWSHLVDCCGLSERHRHKKDYHLYEGLKKEVWDQVYWDRF